MNFNSRNDVSYVCFQALFEMVDLAIIATNNIYKDTLHLKDYIETVAK